MRRGQSTLVAAAVSCGATLIAGSIAWAAIPDGSGTINACYGKVGGIVRVIDATKREKCIAGLETALSWNQRGAQGVPGAPGTSPTVAQLVAGDEHCPAGGAAITDALGSTAYVCSGSDGEAGQDGEDFNGSFTSPNGRYSLRVGDDGIVLSSDGRDVLTIVDSNAVVNAESVGITSDLTTNVQSGLSTAIASGSTLDITTGASATLTTGANLSVATGAATTMSTGTNLGVTAGGNTSINVAKDTQLTTRGVAISASGAASVSTATNLDVQAGGATQFVTGTDATISTGGSLVVSAPTGIAVDSDDEISIDSADDITIDSAADIRIRASGDVTIQASNVFQN